MSAFINLHTNSEYSFLDSTIRIKDLVSWASNRQQEYLVLTDRNNLHAVDTFVFECRKHNLKPIIGLELDLEKSKRIILISKNQEGFVELSHLSYLALSNGFVKLEELKSFSQNLILINHPRSKFALAKSDFAQVQIENYFTSDNNLSDPHSLEMYEIKVAKADDAFVLKILNSNGRITENNDYQIHSLEEVNTSSEEMKKRILHLIKDATFVFKKPTKIFPKFAVGDHRDPNEILKDLTLKKLNKNKKLFPNPKETLQRLKFELEVIKDFGFAEYFFMFYNILNYARQEKILVGPGRGSAAGSLVSFLLGITSVNPLEYGLYFERFLNPDRQTLPDIDIDIEDDRRDELIGFVRKFYGEQRVASISAYSQLGARSATRDVARYLKSTKDPMALEDSLTDAASKALLQNFTIRQNLKMKNNSTLNRLRYHEEWEKILNLYNLAQRIESLPRQVTTHAAGLLIATEPIIHHLPVFLSNNLLQIQFDKTHLEKLGFIKLDLLGLTNLSLIKEIEKQILNFNPQFKVDLNPQDLKDDLAIQKLLDDGLTLGIFQLESPNMTRIFKQAKVRAFKDVYDIISLYRPGPMQHIKEYLLNKNNPQLVKKLSPEYDAIVKDTHGILIYQEQIMEIVQAIANLSLAEADILRRAISKKDFSLLKNLKEKFLSGAQKNGYDAKVIKSIYKNIEDFAAYGFNKSHAVAYAFIVYKMLYYKAHFPFIFYKVLFNSLSQDKKKIALLAEEAGNLNLAIHSPEINHHFDFSNDTKNIYLPFLMINSFGRISYGKLLDDFQKNGKYLDFQKTIFRLQKAGLSESNITTLIKANVLRKFGHINYLSHNVIDIFEQHKNYLLELKRAKNKEAVEIPQSFLEDVERDLQQETKFALHYLGKNYSDLENQNASQLSNLAVGSSTTLTIEIINKKSIPHRHNLRLITFTDFYIEGIMWVNSNDEDIYNELEEKKRYSVVITKVNSKRANNVFKIVEIKGVHHA